MSDNPFDRLLQEFRDGHARYGGGGFEVVLPAKSQNSGYFKSPACEFLGSIFWRETGDTRIHCRLAFGNLRGENWEPSGEAIKLFANLCRRAGAHLPLAMQRAFSVKPNDPAGAWLTFMWRYSPPYDKQFSEGEMFWPEPFLSAANAIEEAGLCGAPAVPIATKGVTDRGGTNVPSETGPSTAVEAVRMIGDEWATHKQLAGVTGKSESAIRAAIKRARDKNELPSEDVREIHDSRPGTPRIRLRIRGVWRFLSIDGERSGKK